MEYNINNLCPVHGSSGEITDFALTNGSPIITDFSQLSNSLLSTEDKTITISEAKIKIELKSIQELKEVFIRLFFRIFRNNLLIREHILNKPTPDEVRISNLFASLKNELWYYFIYQLVFDVLYDKYRLGSEVMTMNKYCTNFAYIDQGSNWVKISDLHADRHNDLKNTTYQIMKREIDFEVQTMNNPSLRDDMMKLGVDPDIYLEYLDSRTKLGKKKPKYVWDYVYYNGNSSLISYKQSRRIFGKDPKGDSWRDSNYTYEDFRFDLCRQDNFIKTFMEAEYDSCKDYFLKSMGFYHFEIYKRLDFAYKLAIRMENAGLSEIDRNYFLVKRFHPIVFYPHVIDNALYYNEKYKYYRPLLFIEEKYQENSHFDHQIYSDILTEFYYARAKIYELFHYNYKFVSDDYNDIENFIRNHYNVLDYHEKNKIWTNQDSKISPKEKRIMKYINEINNALFWESPKRERVVWDNPSKKTE